MQTETETVLKDYASERPMVSVILATYNEEKSIENCLASILEQETRNVFAGEFDLEVLVVDGMSTDRTRALLDRYAAGDPRLRVLNNPRRRAPFAFNIGLRAAHGDYVCILGAHSVYRCDYIAVCLDELAAHNAAACGGRVCTVPANSSLSARLCAWAMSHPFGSSGKSFRTQREGPVDTINYAVFRRDLVLDAGGYDEKLLRNQDNDLNQKLRALGYDLWCTWKTDCSYCPQATVRGLLRYGYGNGFWNALSLARNRSAMGIRHFVPFLFVVALGLAALLAIAGALAPAVPAWMAIAPLAVIAGLHLGLGSVAAVQIAARERCPAALLLPFVFWGFHMAYGFGTLRGFLTRPWNAWPEEARLRRGSIPLGR